MINWQCIDEIIGFQTADQVQTKFGRERVSSIRQVIFIYYLAILIPFLGVALSHPTIIATKITAAIFAMAVCLRFKHYIKAPPPEKSEAENPIAARKTAAMVVLLSSVQAYFFIAISRNSDSMADGLVPLTLGMVAALMQGSALTGVIFASRVIFWCFTVPITLGIIHLSLQQAPPIAFIAISVAAISLYLAELCHKRQLNLFQAQENASEALASATEANIELAQARVIAQRRSEYDGLTGIRNRSAFLNEVGSKFSKGSRGALAIIDLDNFKPINDLYGHPAGDFVLTEIAGRLQDCLPTGSLVGRLGGDEFAIFLDSSRHLEDSLAVFDRVIDEIKRPIALNHGSVRLGAALGAQVFSNDVQSVQEALKDADDALYIAKRRRLPAVKLFDEAMRRERLRKAVFEAELKSNGAKRSFSLVYQPIFNLETDELSSLEALARWDNPDIGSISPAEFIPLIEQLGLVKELTLQLLTDALRLGSALNSANCVLSFNLSAAHICSDEAANELLKLVREADFPAHLLQFEITETALMGNFDAARRNIEALRNFGCRVILDDFGAGYASLVYLREIQFDKIKIDGSLITSSNEDHGRAMLCGVINMISAMGLETVVEHIETAQHRRLAVELGATYGQGFYWGRPYNEDEAHAFLKRYVDRTNRLHQSELLRAS